MAKVSFFSLLPDVADNVLSTLKKILAVNCNRDPITYLAAAARTATTSGANIDVASAKGIVLYLNVTAASGTGGLHVGFFAVLPDGTSREVMAYQATAFTTTGRCIMIVYPGGGILATPTGRITSSDYGVRLPPLIRPLVTHDDASSYTYSLEYALLP